MTTGEFYFVEETFMGKTALLDAFAQSDLDMQGHHILNCPELVPASGPNDFPAQLHKWVNAYSAATHNFGASQPGTNDLLDWPNPVGHGGQVLSALTSGGYAWVPQAGGGGASGFNGYINVKNTGLPSGNALGDGVHDDTVAIQGAINAAVGGLTVYFPTGTYRLTAKLTTPAGNMTLLGDSPWSSVLRMDIGVASGAILDVSASTGSLVQRLGFNGNIFSASYPSTVPYRNGIYASGASDITIKECLAYGCLGFGFAFQQGYQIIVQDCIVGAIGLLGIVLYFCPKSQVRGNVVNQTQEAGIWLVNSQGSMVANNQVSACGPFSYGLGVLDSDNSAVVGNVVQQCGVGVHLGISSTRAQGGNWDLLRSYGYTFVGNTVCRNYFGGVQVMNCHGFKITGNVLTDNGQGASDGINGYTIEPGMSVPVGALQGANYVVGDVLQLDPSHGAGTPAKVVVSRVATGGKIWPSGLFPLNMGAYTTFPSNPVPLIGGSGSGASCYYSGSNIAAGGSGYTVGQALRHNVADGGAFYNPVRVLVTSVSPSVGAVTGYLVIDGGGYLNPPTYSTLNMVSDAYSPETANKNDAAGILADPLLSTGTGPAGGKDYADLPAIGSGFSILAGWGRRYSIIFAPRGPGSTFNLETYHGINGGVVSGNVIDYCKSGCGYLNLGGVPYAPPSATDRAGYLVFSGNVLRGNLYPFKGGSVATGGAVTLDNNYNIPASGTTTPLTSIFDSEIVDGGGTLIGTGPLNIIE